MEYSESRREAIGVREGYVSSVGNLFLFVIKLIFGIISNSYALIVDSVHSLSDIITSIVVIAGFKISSRPADKEHPFGHQRAEIVATLIVAVLLVVIGVEFAQSGIRKIFHPNKIKVDIWLFIVVILTIIFKELMAQYSFYLERKIGSDTLKADAWHHRTDSISSVLVLVSIGASYYGIFWLDGAMAFLISLFIIFIGIRIMINPINDLLGTAPSAELVRKIREIAFSYDGVIGVHDIVLNGYGRFNIGSVHLVLPSSLTLKEAHEKIDEIENDIREKLGVVITIHIDPVDESDMLYKKVKMFLDSCVEERKEIKEIHDIHIVKHLKIIKLYFEIRFAEKSSNNKLKKELQDEILKRFPQIDEVSIEDEPEYSY